MVPVGLSYGAGVHAAVAVLVAFLVVYALFGLIMGLNLRRIAERWAAFNRRIPRLIRPWGGGDVNLLRLGGWFMAAFGAIFLTWLAFQGWAR